MEPVGATTTRCVEQLGKRGLSLTNEEATLLMLGIYEDTGSLTYDTTTARDIRAAAWLLGQGALLPVVRRFLNIPLTPTQRDFVAVRDGEVVGWSFLWHLDAKDPDKGPWFGLGVADAYHGHGLGTELTRRVLTWADAQGLPYTVLIVVTDNAVAEHIYEKAGFVRYGEFLHEDRGLSYYRMRRDRGSGLK